MALEMLDGQRNSLQCTETAPSVEYASDYDLIEHLVIHDWIGG